MIICGLRIRSIKTISSDDVIHTTMNTFPWTMLESSLGIIYTCSVLSQHFWIGIVAIGNAQPNEINLETGRTERLHLIPDYRLYPQNIANGTTISLLIPSSPDD